MATLTKFLLCWLLLFGSPAWGAELLVMAVDGPHWSHAKKGDVVCVHPDGHEWGVKDGQPLFVVVKMPGVKVEDAKQYEEALIETRTLIVDGKEEHRTELIRDRKYHLAPSVVDSIKLTGKDAVVIEEKDIDDFKAQIAIKVLADEKAAVAAEKIAIGEESIEEITR